MFPIDETALGFHPVDRLFAKRFTDDEEGQFFLAYLLKVAREGHLCVTIEGERLTPSLAPEWDPHLIAGSQRVECCPAVVHENTRWYLHRNWKCEQNFLHHLARLKAAEPQLTIPQDLLATSLADIPLEAEQKEAILTAAKQTITLICGGPGTGKTYTAALLIHHFRSLVGGEIVMAAPTGKAAVNLRRAVGGSVSTLHSLLGKPTLSTADLVLVDEGSMVDAEIMARLFASIKEGARLILLGDKDQLPPVEAGNFFADLSETSVELKTCLRAELQEIVDLAATVKRGEEIPCHPLEGMREVLKRKVLDEGWRALSPLRRGPFGVDTLNGWLYKEHLKRKPKEVPIMITTNDRALELYNGDVGVLDCERGCGRFGEREIPEYALPHYEYAYVLSVHKSQGSEYDSVLVLLPDGSEVFGREVLYTAITRAKRRVEVYARPETLKQIVSKRTHRHSGLTP